jgi:predicted kinase
MDAVIFIGMQATGKSTFYRERFFNTHIRINLDMLKTRHREQVLFSACMEAKQSFVIDKTNPTAEDRVKYIAPARIAGFRIIGYYFASKIQDALKRNATREPAHRVPDVGLLGTHAKLQLPSKAEGFDELYYVSFDERSGFKVEEWKNEV